MSAAIRQWYDYQGNLVSLDDETPLTMYDGLNHALSGPTNPPTQMLTRCGKRGCPSGRLRQVPARGPVDCPECIASDLTVAIRAAIDETERQAAEWSDNGIDGIGGHLASLAGRQILAHIAAHRKILDERDEAATYCANVIYTDEACQDCAPRELEAWDRVVELLAESYGIRPANEPT